MTPAQVIKHWKTQAAAAKAIGVCQPTVSTWLTAGAIPALQQLRIQTVSHGALKADAKVLKRYARVCPN